ncbi:peptidoglycan D,D-transpeptidase FtsI family protein [Rhizobium oryziradicis]|uniref:Cell division protein n=1 Tax=Rhizobium oryziradicis TaxID=1867956 RepID=A0A1Q8ZXT2_9HYPH|nr:cell division protein [Rhizobium oryziradicis]
MSIVQHFSSKAGRLRELKFSVRSTKRQFMEERKRHRQAKSRIAVISVGVLLFYAALFAKLGYMGAETLPDISKILPPVQIAWRPDIVDRNGQILATDIRTVSMFADPHRIVDVDEAVEKICGLFPDLDRKSLYKKLSDRKSHFAWLERQLTPEQQNQVMKLGLPAIGFRPEVKRFYPGGRTAAHVLGYVDIDNHGVSGMEKYIDSQGLSDLAATGLATPNTLEPFRLSIDLRVQNIVHDVISNALTTYKAQAAGAVVLDIHTGEVLAMASVPDFDPNDPQGTGGQGWLNRMSNGTFEMGSTFKTFSMAMAFDTNSVKLTDTFDATSPLHIGRFTIHDDRDVPRRFLTVPEVFRYSSNIGTAKIIEVVGIDAQKEYLTRLGLLTRLKTELPEVKTPSLPRVWSKLTSITVSFGHGVATTPLQVAVAGAALMDGGELIEPTFLPRTAAEAEKTETSIVRKTTSDTIRYLFKLNGEQGTGRTADVMGFHVGGKTGTANKVINGVYSHKLSFNSFLGAFPINNPKYVVLAIIDQPLTGLHNLNLATETAAPMVHDIIARAAPLLGVEEDVGKNTLVGY